MRNPAGVKEKAGTISALWLPADMLFLMRPVVLAPVWIVYAAGSLAAGSWPGIDLVFVTLIVAGVYVHNQLTDLESDRLNGKLFILAEGYVSQRTAWILTCGVWIAALTWAGFQETRMWLYIAALVLGVVYNGLPVRNTASVRPWKARPWLGFAANFLAHGPVTYLAGWTAAGGSLLSGIGTSVSYGCAVGAVYLATTMVDLKGDTAVSKQTWAVVYGLRRTAATIVVLLFAGLISAAAVRDWSMCGACVFAMLAALPMLKTPSSTSADRFAKAGILGLAVVVAAAWPVLVGLTALTYALSRLYYRHRFGFTYPRMTNEQQ